MKEETFRPSINGLRGIAVLMVVLFHWSHIRGGFTGVDVFFVISGYLISGQIFRDLSLDRFSLLGFYARRTRRIIPSLVVILLFGALTAWLFSFNDQVRQVGAHVRSGALFVSNFQLYGESGYFDAAMESKPLMHLWSLGIEEQFYLLWPILLAIAYRFFGGILGAAVVATVLSFAANLYFSVHDPALDFYLLPSRLWELSFGCLIFATHTRLRTFLAQPLVQLAGIALILYGCFTIRGQAGFPGTMALIPVLGAGLLLGAPESALINRSLLSTRFLGFFGTISYTLYLWHWPLFSFMKSLMLEDSMVLLTGLAIGLAYLTHRLVEKPLMSWPVTDGNRMKMVASGGAALVTVAFGGFFVANGTVEGRMHSASLPPAIDKRIGNHCSINGGSSSFSPGELASCSQTPFPGAPLVLVLGDSHAGSISDGMDVFAGENHINVIVWTATYCTPLSLNDRRPTCRAFNEHIERFLTTRKPDLVMVVANHKQWADDDGYGEALPYEKYLVKRLAEVRALTGKKVLLVGQNPTYHISLTRVLNIAFLSRGIPVPERTFTGLESDSLQSDQNLRQGSSDTGVPYFSIKDELCSSDGCRVRVGTNLETDLMEFDYGHLTHNGAIFVVKNGLGARMKTLLESR